MTADINPIELHSAKAMVYYTVFEDVQMPIDKKHIQALPDFISEEIFQYKIPVPVQ